MTRWYALTEVPQPIRDTMRNVWARWEQRAQSLNTVMSLIQEDQLAARHVTTMTRALDVNQYRVPVLCEAVRSAHKISLRKTWLAVGLFLDMHASSVQRIWYKRPL